MPTVRYVDRVDVPNGHDCENFKSNGWEPLVCRAVASSIRRRISDYSASRWDYKAQEILDDVEGDGQWTTIQDLKVGDVVRVDKSFATADESLPVLLQRFTNGVVEYIDVDGDASVRFPSLTGLKCCACRVLRGDFGKLLVHRPVQKEAEGWPETKAEDQRCQAG